MTSLQSLMGCEVATFNKLLYHKINSRIMWIMWTIQTPEVDLVTHALFTFLEIC